MKKTVLATALLVSLSCQATLSPLIRSTQQLLPAITAATPKLLRSISLQSSRKEIQDHYASKNIVTQKNDEQRTTFWIEQLENCKTETEKQKLRKKLFPATPTLKDYNFFKNLYEIDTVNKAVKHKTISSKQDLFDWKNELEQSKTLTNKVLGGSLGIMLLDLVAHSIIPEIVYHGGLGLSFAGIGLSILKANFIEKELNFIKKELEILNK